MGYLLSNRKKLFKRTQINHSDKNYNNEKNTMRPHHTDYFNDFKNQFRATDKLEKSE
jgi:chorismate synthase